MYIFLFVIGLVAGSFLNVVSLRYKEGGNVFDVKAIGGRSKCLTCQKQLSWKELIPLISFFFQKGQCRHCGHKLSLQYPIVELLSGLIFVLVPFMLHDTSFMIQGLWLLVFLLLLLLSSIDFRLYVIPDSLQIILAISGIVLTFFTQKIGTFGHFKGSFLDFYAFIFGFRENDWAQAVAPELSRPFFSDEKGRDLRRKIGANALVVDLDSQGRFVMPENMALFAGITSGGVTLIGAGDHFEIWNANAWEKCRQQLAKS